MAKAPATKRLTVFLTLPQRIALKRLAAQRGLSMTKLVAGWISAKLARAV